MVVVDRLRAEYQSSDNEIRPGKNKFDALQSRRPEPAAITRGLSANLGFIRQPGGYPPTRPWGTGWCWGRNVKPLSVPQENPCIYPRVFAIRGNPYDVRVRVYQLKNAAVATAVLS
jgi:hypothetical protein